MLQYSKNCIKVIILDENSGFENKKIIHSAFFTILEKKNYSLIKSQDICHEAKIDRTTFDQYYYTKDDLLEDVINEFVSKSLVAMSNCSIDSNYEQTTSVNGLFNFVYAFKNQLKILLANHLKPIISQKLHQHYMSFYSEKLKKLCKNRLSPIEESLLIQLKTNELVFSIFFFIDHCDSYSPEEFTKVYTQITNGDIHQYL